MNVSVPVRPSRCLVGLVAATLVAVSGCTAPGDPDQPALNAPITKLTDEQAWPIARENYDRGWVDGGFFTLVGPRGTTGGDIGGLAGNAWSRGFHDVIDGHAFRNDEQLHLWLDRQRHDPHARLLP
ncbi:MAG: hypothetical protein AAGE65_11645 [Planctomycetota bacterium]